jgi:hypothetical protein
MTRSHTYSRNRKLFVGAASTGSAGSAEARILRFWPFTRRLAHNVR